MPTGLPPLAQEYWRHYLPIVQAMGVMTVADVDALGQLCLYTAEVRECTELITKMGRLLPRKDEKGQVIAVYTNPACRVRSDAARHVRSLLAAFGLEPSSRSKVSVPDPGASISDPLEAIRRAKNTSDVVH